MSKSHVQLVLQIHKKKTLTLQFKAATIQLKETPLRKLTRHKGKRTESVYLIGIIHSEGPAR